MSHLMRYINLRYLLTYLCLSIAGWHYLLYSDVSDIEMCLVSTDMFCQVWFSVILLTSWCRFTAAAANVATTELSSCSRLLPSTELSFCSTRLISYTAVSQLTGIASSWYVGMFSVKSNFMCQRKADVETRYSLSFSQCKFMKLYQLWTKPKPLRDFNTYFGLSLWSYASMNWTSLWTALCG